MAAPTGRATVLRKLGKVTRIKREQDASVPPGQFATEKFPVMTYGPTPDVATSEWRFRTLGLVGHDVMLTWEQLTTLEKVTVEAEFHCVTQWSRMQNAWEGARFSEVMSLALPLPEAKFAMVHCYGGYTTNISLDALMEDDVLLAYRHDGALLPRDHGGPVRLVVPKRYGWKSAKWVSGVELIAEDAPGFWERNGYHMEGYPWQEQRFR